MRDYSRRIGQEKDFGVAVDRPDSSSSAHDLLQTHAAIPALAGKDEEKCSICDGFRNGRTRVEDVGCRGSVYRDKVNADVDFVHVRQRYTALISCSLVTECAHFLNWSSLQKYLSSPHIQSILRQENHLLRRIIS